MSTVGGPFSYCKHMSSALRIVGIVHSEQMFNTIIRLCEALPTHDTYLLIIREIICIVIKNETETAMN